MFMPPRAKSAGWLIQWKFFANGGSLGVVTNLPGGRTGQPVPSASSMGGLYFRWTNAPIGSNVLTAVAIDNNRTLATSAPVSITVTTNIYHPRRGR